MNGNINKLKFKQYSYFAVIFIEIRLISEKHQFRLTLHIRKRSHENLLPKSKKRTHMHIIYYILSNLNMRRSNLFSIPK